MAGYCGVTALLWKRFWQPGDFWRAGDSKGRNLFWDFLKNFSLAGGFLLLAFGLHEGDFKAFMKDPLASSMPYAAPTHQRERRRLLTPGAGVPPPAALRRIAPGRPHPPRGVMRPVGMRAGMTKADDGHGRDESLTGRPATGAATRVLVVGRRRGRDRARHDARAGRPAIGRPTVRRRIVGDHGRHPCR